MTSHRLVRCRLDELVEVASTRHPQLRVSATEGQAPGAPVPRRRRPYRLVWQERAALGGRLTYRLDLEQGANGVLAHLSAAAPEPSPVPPAAALGQVVRQWRTGRELDALLRAAEDLAGPRDRFQQHGYDHGGG